MINVLKCKRLTGSIGVSAVVLEPFAERYYKYLFLNDLT